MPRGRRATVRAFLPLRPVDILIPPRSGVTVPPNFRARSTIMSGRALLLASALAATLAMLPAGTAGAASWLEMNFYLSGPRYEGVLPPCDHEAALSKIA